MKKVYVFFGCLVILASCGKRGVNNREMYSYKGFAMDEAFMIEYDKTSGNLDLEIKKLIREIENELLLSDSSSFIFRLNHNDSIGGAGKHFIALFKMAQQVNIETKGAYDPTYETLIEYWNRDTMNIITPASIDSGIIDSLKRNCGLNHFILSQSLMYKKSSRSRIDFGQASIGYTIDQLAVFLDGYGMQNYRIEMGSSTRVKGSASSGKPWEMGLDEPIDNPQTRQMIGIVNLTNAYGSAGSYRKYIKYGEMKLPSTIDPTTGYPVQHTLLAAYVFAPTSTEAVLYSSAFMVMGVQKTIRFVTDHPDLDVYLISTNYKGEWITYLSEGLKSRTTFLKLQGPI